MSLLSVFTGLITVSDGAFFVVLFIACLFFVLTIRSYRKGGFRRVGMIGALLGTAVFSLERFVRPKLDEAAQASRVKRKKINANGDPKDTSQRLTEEDITSEE